MPKFHLSHLCAFVTESLKVKCIPSGIYFCRLQYTSDDGGHPGSPLDLVKSLIIQLMWRFNSDLSIVDQNPPDDYKLNAGEWLCLLLQKLLNQLPAGAVLFWIVDRVPYLGEYEIVETTCQVFRELIDMIETSNHAIAKFLITSAYKGKEVGGVVGVENILETPEMADGDRQGIFAMGLEETASLVPALSFDP